VASRTGLCIPEWIRTFTPRGLAREGKCLQSEVYGKSILSDGVCHLAFLHRNGPGQNVPQNVPQNRPHPAGRRPTVPLGSRRAQSEMHRPIPESNSYSRIQ
jgi:hypothetical protein